MLTYFGKNYDFEDIEKRIGCYNQLFGMKRYSFTDGKAKDVAAVDIRTGSGLSYTVLPGRGMDIAWTEFKGIPISHMTPVGIVAPQYFEPHGDEWLRSFTAGLLTTCGLDQVGNECVISEKEYPLHGRIANIPAENVCTEEDFNADKDYEMLVSGTVRQVKQSCQNLVMKRKISSVAGKNTINITDKFQNKSFERSPFMLLYHFNLGFPFLNENFKLMIPHSSISSMYENREKDMENAQYGDPPQNGYMENVFYYEIEPDGEGLGNILAINDKFNPTLGMLIQFPFCVLPRVAQWKQMGFQDYVMGIEPCNNYVKGLKDAIQQKNLRYIEGRQEITVNISISFLEGGELDLIMSRF